MADQPNIWAKFRVSKEDVAGDMQGVASEVQKQLKKIDPGLSGWQKSRAKALQDDARAIRDWKTAVQRGMGDAFKASSIKGLRDISGRDIAKISGLGDIADLHKGTIKGLRDITGKDISKVSGLPDINSYNAKKEKVDWKQVAIGAGLGFSNPYIGSRVLSDQLGKLSGGKGGGLFGKGGIVGFSEIFIAFKGLKLALEGLKKVVGEVAKQYENARLLYAKTLMTGGLSTQFVAQRSAMANVLGVSEDELMKFGQQVQRLAPKLQWSSSILAKVNPQLTSVGWEMKILGYNLEAMFSTIANDGAPALRKFIEGMNEIIKMATEFYNKFKTPIQGLASGFAQGTLNTAFGQLGGQIAKYAIKGITSLGGLHDTGAAPAAVSNMKQLRASTFEHMGLVLGGGGNNPAQETAKNTGRTAKILEQMHAAIMRNRGGIGHNFGLVPSVNNP